MKTLLITMCFAIVLLPSGGAGAQGTMNHDNTQADDKKVVEVTGTISDPGKMFVSDGDNKSWTITKPDAVKGHEGHHVILTASVDLEKNEVQVVSVKMAK